MEWFSKLYVIVYSSTFVKFYVRNYDSHISLSALRDLILSCRLF